MNSDSEFHVTDDRLLDYFEQSLGPLGESKVEEHIAVCAECAQRASSIYSASLFWPMLTAKRHGLAYRQGVLAPALSVAALRSGNEGVRHCLELWVKRLTEAARRFEDSVASAGTAAADGARAGWEAVAEWGAVARLALVSEVPPLPCLGRGLPVLGPTEVSPEVEVGYTDQSITLAPGVQLTLTCGAGSRGVVRVRIEGLPAEAVTGGSLLPLLALIPADGREAVVIELAQDVSAENSLVLTGEQSGVLPGQYTVGLSPLRLGTE
jgi:hypothetical protein